MSLIGISAKARITSDSLVSLTRGSVPVGVAAKLGTTRTSIQTFINGGTSVGLAAHIGCTSSSLQELRNVIGEQGAIGLLIGLCIGAEREER